MEAIALNKTLGNPMATEPRANHPKGGYIYFKNESASNKPHAIVSMSGHFFSFLVSPCGLKLASSLAVFSASAETITQLKDHEFLVVNQFCKLILYLHPIRIYYFATSYY
jgi:hypothetical protein